MKIIHKRKRLILGMFLVIALAFFSVYDFNVQLQTDLRLQEKKNLQEFSAQNNALLQDKLENKQQILSVLSAQLADANRQSEQAIRELLQIAASTGHFDRIGLSNRAGDEISNVNEKINIADREYFQRSLKGESVITDPIISRVTDDPSIILSVPFLIEGSIRGVIRGEYSIGHAADVLLKSYREGLGNTVIVKSNGQVVLNNGMAQSYDNILDYFKSKKFVRGYSFEQLTDHISQKQGSSFWIYDNDAYESQKKLISFSPAGINDWYSFSIISDEFMQYQKSTLYLLAFELLMKVAVLLIAVFLIGFLHINKTQKKNERIILAEKEKHLALLSRINGSIVLNEFEQDFSKLTTQYANEHFTALTGFSLQDLQQQFQGLFLKLIHPEDLEGLVTGFHEQTQMSSTYQLQYRLLTKSKGYQWVIDFGYVEDQGDGRTLNQALITDISRLKEQEELLQLEHECLRTALELTKGCVFAYDLINGTYLQLENTEPIFGCSAAEFLDYSKSTLEKSTNSKLEGVLTGENYFHPEDAEIVKEGYKQLLNKGKTEYEARVIKFNGECIWCHMRMLFVYSGTNIPMRVIGNIVDIHDAKEKLEEMKTRAEKDFLTGLYNKETTEVLINNVMSRYADESHAIMLLDIDGFKLVNDRFGHMSGDLLLRKIGFKLQQLCRYGEIIGRIGGDEFIIFHRNIPDRKAILKKAEHIQNALRGINPEGEDNYCVSCSIGIVFTEPNTRFAFKDLYKKADAVMYQAKNNGKDQFCVYHPTNTDTCSTRRKNDRD